MINFFLDLLFIPPGFEYGLLFNENGEVTQSNSLDGSGKKRTTKRGVKTETVFDLSSLVNVDNTLLGNFSLSDQKIIFY